MLPPQPLIRSKRVAIADFALTHGLPLAVVARDGYLIAAPGRVVDFDYVARKLRGIFDRCDVRAIAFDRALMKFFRPALVRAGFTDAELERFVEHGQGFLGMGPAIRALEERLLAGKLKHGNHPLLRMCAANAQVLVDDASNRKFSKRRSTGRIDLLVALAMACSVLAPDIVEPRYGASSNWSFDGWRLARLRATL